MYEPGRGSPSPTRKSRVASSKRTHGYITASAVEAVWGVPCAGALPTVAAGNAPEALGCSWPQVQINTVCVLAQSGCSPGSTKACPCPRGNQFNSYQKGGGACHIIQNNQVTYGLESMNHSHAGNRTGRPVTGWHPTGVWLKSGSQFKGQIKYFSLLKDSQVGAVFIRPWISKF